MTPSPASSRTRARWTRLPRLGAAAALAAVALVAGPAATVSAQDASPAPAATGFPSPHIDVSVPAHRDTSHPRLATDLRDELGARPATPATPGTRAADPVTTVVVQSSDVAATRQAVSTAGGSVTEVAGALVKASVPSSALGTLADAPGSAFVRKPYPAHREAVTSEGVGETGATPWITAGHNGAGVKVAILDVGFDGFAAAETAGDLPNVETDLSRCPGTGGTSHGTAVAEIVHQEAPGAALYLVCAQDDVDFASAAATLNGHGVKVVNGSVGFTISGRGDGSGGSGSVAAAVANLRAQGILYVASAGNYGAPAGSFSGLHWSFAATGDQDLNAPPEDDFVSIDANEGAQADKELDFGVLNGGKADISMAWDEWPISTDDFDVYALSPDCVNLAGDPILFGSTNQQSDEALPPVEGFAIDTAECLPVNGQFITFGLVVDRFAGHGTPRTDLWFDGEVGGIEEGNGGDVVEPANSPAAMAVGAYCVNGGGIEPYSSTGPTIDGRTKPDIAGPDNVSSAVAEFGAAAPNCQSGFLGTSAAAPHVTGAAADLLAANPNLDVAELQGLLERRAQDGGAAGKDTSYGSGRLRLGASGDAAPPTPRRLTPLTPTRLFDSRPGTLGASEAAFGASGRTTPIGANSEVAVQVAGIAGVPADATAVVLNVTATNPTAQGWITVHPSGAVPNASNLDFKPGQTTAAHVTATVGPDGKVRFYNSAGTTDLVIDISGWYGPTSPGNAGLTTLAAPARAIDTRGGVSGFAEGGDRSTPVGPGGELQVPLAGLGGIPANASAVVVNLTVTQPTAQGWLTAYPTGSAVPTASSLNFVPGLTVANLVVVPVGTDGKISIFNSHGSSHVVVDAIGYFTPGAGAGYVALDPPDRDLDTRTGNGPRLGPIGPNGTYKLPVAHYYGVPALATGVQLNVIGVFPTQQSWLTVYPGTAALPGASNVDYDPGSIVPNAVISAIGGDGTVAFTNARGTVDVVADIAGYYVLP